MSRLIYLIGATLMYLNYFRIIKVPKIILGAFMLLNLGTSMFLNLGTSMLLNLGTSMLSNLYTWMMLLNLST